GSGIGNDDRVGDRRFPVERREAVEILRDRDIRGGRGRTAVAGVIGVVAAIRIGLGGGLRRAVVERTGGDDRRRDGDGRVGARGEAGDRTRQRSAAAASHVGDREIGRRVRYLDVRSCRRSCVGQGE